MAVLINLLPDVRQAKLRAKRRRQLAVGVATVIVAASVGVVVLLMVITLAQKARIADLDRQIQENHGKFMAIDDIKLMVTVQQHMDSIPGVWASRTAMEQFFETLSRVSPTDMQIRNLEFNGTSLAFTGEARSYSIVHKFTEALEASNIELGPNASEDNEAHFTDVTLEGASRDSGTRVSFRVTADMSTGVTSAQE